MTTLVAFQGEDFAVVGCDSRATEDGGFFMDLATPKIVKNGDYLIAVSGASRGGNIAQFGWTPPKPPNSNNRVTLDKFMTKKVIPSLRRAFLDAGFDAKDDGEAAWMDSNLFIIFNGVVYPVFNDYSWDREIRNVYFAGSGGELACGALAALGVDEDMPLELIEDHIRRSIEISCQWSAFSSPPVIIMTQSFR